VGGKMPLYQVIPKKGFFKDTKRRMDNREGLKERLFKKLEHTLANLKLIPIWIKPYFKSPQVPITAMSF